MMSKFKISIVTGTVAFVAVLSISMPAMADDPVIPNAADASIPITETVNAGSSVDMNGITYTIDVAKQTYGTANTQHPTLAKGTSVYDDGATPLEAAAPIVIKPSETAKTTDGDFTDVWNISRSLTDLFGPASNFPRAGMYEYTIKQSHAGGSSTDADKWEYDEPEFLLQVLVKTSTTDVTVLEYGGWTLSKWDADQGKYVKVNSGGDDDPDGAAAFSETYKAKSQLNVTKQVSGDYASTTWQFPQTITVTLPEWYSEATDGAIQPRDGESLAEGDVTIMRKSTEGNTIVFETALAHGQTATLTVPVGTRYEVKETTNGEGLASDGAGLEYTPKIDWTVDDGKNIATRPWNSLTIVDLSYEQARAIADNLKLYQNGVELTPTVWIRPYENLYDNSRGFQFAIQGNYYEETDEGDDGIQNSETLNLYADGIGSFGFSRLVFEVSARSTNMNYATLETEEGWKITDFELVYNNVSYTLTPGDISANDGDLHAYRNEVDLTQDSLPHIDLASFIASLANGLSKGPIPEDSTPRYEAPPTAKSWGALHSTAYSGCYDNMSIWVEITTDNAEALQSLPSDILEAAQQLKTSAEALASEGQQPGYDIRAYIYNSEPITALNENGIITQQDFIDFLFGGTEWTEWLMENNIQKPTAYSPDSTIEQWGNSWSLTSNSNGS